MSVPSKKQTLFDLSGGHPALDLVNSLDNRFRADGPNENLLQYTDLLRFLGESDLLDPQRIRLLNKAASGKAAEQVLREVKELREATAAVFYAAMEERTPAHSDVQTLSAISSKSAATANCTGTRPQTGPGPLQSPPTTTRQPTWPGNGVLRPSPILTSRCGSSPSRCQIFCSRPTQQEFAPAR